MEGLQSDQRADKVQVFLFHATQRCPTCIAIGKLAGETVYEYFQPELKDGKIEFREINIDLPENRGLAQKFQASGSSLFINAIYNSQDNISQDTRVWRLTQDEAQFKSYLKVKIKELLG
jgi:thiol-disulfide isomerase/thioredoxin